MSRVLSNNTSFALAFEDPAADPPALPVSPTWHLVEPNSIGKGGPEITTVAREPLSKSRQNRKGGVTDLDSGWNGELDTTREHLLYLLPPTMYTRWVGPAYFRVIAVDATTGYQVASGGALPAGTLVVATGHNLAANNSPETFKVVTGGSDATHVHVAGVATEAAIPEAQNALLEVAGFRGAAADLSIEDGSLVSAGAIDFTDLPLKAGQFIWIGGDAVANHAFANAANRGLARIRSITADTITLDKKLTTFVDDAGTGKTVDIFFGRWARNVDVDHVDYLEQPIRVETRFHDLGGVGTPEYQYAYGNRVNEMELALPGQNKSTCTVDLIGTDTPVPTTSRATNAAAPVRPTQVTMYNTSSDLTRLRVAEVDETGVTSDVREMTVTFGNNVSPEKILGVLGARYMNSGNFDAMADMTIVLVSSAVMGAVRTNRKMSAELGLRNTDGAFLFDFPTVTLGAEPPEFTPDESVTMPLKLMAVQDEIFGYTMSVSCFPYLPAA